MNIKSAVVVSLCLFVLSQTGCRNGGKPDSLSGKEVTDSLPFVLPGNHSDLINKKLRLEASVRFAEHQLPCSPDEWQEYRVRLRNEIMRKASIVVNHDLPLNINITGTITIKGYVIRNLTFQTLEGVYATANLYMPDGPGPFPAVINMLGHWRKGKIDSTGPQAVGHTLASSGYVCLTIDPWGAGERSTRHGDFEYHGANLGASLMNMGEPLLGIQVTENMRGVDLLCSLPEVDQSKIGATGASGGGNQTMWLSAVDERIKADVPVVSVGSFESYVMESNCICELLPDGLTFTEEAGVLALSNAVLLINHSKDSNPTFFPSEMLRSYSNAAKLFKITGREKNISYRIFDLPHGYEKEDREAMLGWFEMHLKGKGDGLPVKEPDFSLLAESKLMVFPYGMRDSSVITTAEYCRVKGKELRTKFLNNSSFDVTVKRDELRSILRIDTKHSIKAVNRYSTVDGWNRIVVETSDYSLVPLLITPPSDGSRDFVIICHSMGKKNIPLSLVNDHLKSGKGVVIADLSGTGELTSTASLAYDHTARLHTLSRAQLWLGKTILGEWVKELELINQYIFSKYKAGKVYIDGTGEAGLAGLFLGALGADIESFTLRNAPLSYLFDNREHVDYYSMAINLPGFLKWGDLSLAAAMTGRNVYFIDGTGMSGTVQDSSAREYFRSEYSKIRHLCKAGGGTVIN